MPWLPIYADERDLIEVLNWLNASKELAFIVSNGPGRWIAVNEIRSIDKPRLCLWHVPSGPLPLLYPKPSKEIAKIDDPWSGWKELRSGADTSCPLFGTGHTGIFWFFAKPRSQYNPNAIGMSWFLWSGNHHWPLGFQANESTEKFWRAIRRWTKEAATKIPRRGRLDGPYAEIFAFPSAYSAFKTGTPRAAGPDT